MTEATEEAPKGQRPQVEFKGSGGLKVAVWKYRNEDGPDSYSAAITRTYRDKEGEFHTVPHLHDSDLLRVSKLLEQADQWIEQDKSRTRTAQSGQHR